MLPDALIPYAQADIYLIDQILKGRIQSGMQVLDVACGSGRNTRALLASGCTVTGIDLDPQAIAHCQSVFTEQSSSFYTRAVTEMNFGPTFDVVICNALLHFASDKDSWVHWANACWAQLTSGGLLFCRFSTRIGLPDVHPASFAYLADEQCLRECETNWGALRIEPLKTTLVEQLRTMSTWVLLKP